ncbi:MAG: hypothetical protein EOM44_14210 [Bacteroidia bacterium]|nr:hypothetical protein [Bacteroidia bacterium]
MKTKFYFILSILLILPYLNNLLAGNKNFVITKKFNSSKDYYDNSSKMTFSDKDKVTEKSLKKWIVGNSNRLMVKDNLIRIEKYEDVWAYGAYRNTFIKNVYFVKSSNYEAYSNYVAKERLSEEMAGAVAVAGLLGLGKAFYDGAKEGMNDMMTHQSSSSSSSSSNYSSSSKDYEIISSEKADVNADNKDRNRTNVGVQLVEFEDIKRIKWADNTNEPEGYTFEIYIDGDKKWDDKTIKRDKDNNNWYGDSFGFWKICDSKYDREYALKQYFVKRYGDGKDAKEYKFKYR